MGRKICWSILFCNILNTKEHSGLEVCVAYPKIDDLNPAATLALEITPIQQITRKPNPTNNKNYVTTNNSLIHRRPLDNYSCETSHLCKDRVPLVRFKCRHYPALLSYQIRPNNTVADTCPECNIT